MYHQV